MKKFNDLVKTPDYWMEEIQNELYRQLHDYMKKTGKSQNTIAKDLKVSKSYISQILNGNFNFTLKKLIELSLYIGKVPEFKFLSSESYVSELTFEKRYKNEFNFLLNYELEIKNNLISHPLKQKELYKCQTKNGRSTLFINNTADAHSYVQIN